MDDGAAKRSSNRTGAPEALLDWLKYLESAKPASEPPESRDNPFMSERTLPLDRMLVLGHLALLEEQHGSRESAREYWKRSEDQAKLAKWKGPSETAIRIVVNKLHCGDRKKDQGPKP